MKNTLLALFFVCTPLMAQNAKVTNLMAKPLPDFPGKAVQILTVVYPPGSHDPVHRHNAHAFVYVLEGSVVMAVNGEKPVTITAGQMFYEGHFPAPARSGRSRAHEPCATRRPAQSHYTRADAGG